MKGYLIIIIGVFSFHFIVKAFNYQYMRKTKGVVVDYGYNSYGSIRHSFGSHNDVKFPIAQFRDVDNYFDRKEISLEEVIDSTNWDSVNKYNMKYLLLDKEKQLKNNRLEELGVHTTQETEGGFYFSNYQNGDSVGIIYEPGHPNEAIINSFFSYWLTLKSLMLLSFVCILFSGIHTYAKFASQDVTED